MSAVYPVMTGAIIIDATNGTIQLDEAGVVEDGVIPPGTYYLRASGPGGSDDFLDAVRVALNDASALSGGVNTYSVTMTTDGTTDSLSIDGTAPNCTIRIARATGATSFRVKWSNYGTTATLDPALLGFTTSSDKASVNASAELSTVSCRSLWVGSDIVAKKETRPIRIRSKNKLQNGSMDVLKRAIGGVSLELDMVYQSTGRVFARYADVTNSDVNASFARWLDFVDDGRQVEVWLLNLATSPLLTDMSTASQKQAEYISDGTLISTWILDDVTGGEEFAPVRVNNGLELYDFSARFIGYVP